MIPLVQRPNYFLVDLKQNVIKNPDILFESVNGDLEKSDFKLIKEQSASKTEELEKKFNSLQGRDKEIGVLLDKPQKPFRTGFAI